MPHRYFTTDIKNGTARLSPQDSYHFVRVLRGRPGQQLILCDGNAVEYTGTVTAADERCVTLTVTEGYPTVAEPDTAVTVYLGCAKQGRVEEAIRHGVEMGATRFIPFFSRYCVITPKKEGEKRERYQRIAHEAAKQCGRGVLPSVGLPLADVAALCDELEREKYDLALFFYEGGGRPLREIFAACPAPRSVALITGPEGGFAPEEAEMLSQAAQTAGLGPRILRCETAPVAALAAVMLLTGNLE